MSSTKPTLVPVPDDEIPPLAARWKPCAGRSAHGERPGTL